MLEQMRMFQQHARVTLIVGLVVLTIVVVVLMASPQEFITSVDFIDTELNDNSDNRIAVDVKWDLSKEHELGQFPYYIDDWEGWDEDTGGLKDKLGANSLIKRAYTEHNPFNPVYLLIMQSNARTSFHPPVVCYKSLGYDIVEESKDMVTVQDTSWINIGLFDNAPQLEHDNPESMIKDGVISVKKLIVNKEEDNDRRVVLYIYIKESQLSSNIISMLRVSSQVAYSQEDADALARCKELMGLVIPMLFDPGKEENETLLDHMTQMGIGGYFIVVIILSIPLTMIIIPTVIEARKRKGFNCREDNIIQRYML